MGVAELLRWHWQDYPRYHQARFNLLLHIVAVPVFLIGNVALVFGLVLWSWVAAILGLVAMVASVALQGRGHRQEQTPPEPFTSSLNAVSRIFFEQWVTFPRFVLSGGWSQALHQASAS